MSNCSLVGVPVGNIAYIQPCFLNTEVEAVRYIMDCYLISSTRPNETIASTQHNGQGFTLKLVFGMKRFKSSATSSSCRLEIPKRGDIILQRWLNSECIFTGEFGFVAVDFLQRPEFIVGNVPSLFHAQRYEAILEDFNPTNELMHLQDSRNFCKKRRQYLYEKHWERISKLSPKKNAPQPRQEEPGSRAASVPETLEATENPAFWDSGSWWVNVLHRPGERRRADAVEIVASETIRIRNATQRTDGNPDPVFWSIQLGKWILINDMGSAVDATESQIARAIHNGRSLETTPVSPPSDSPFQVTWRGSAIPSAIQNAFSRYARSMSETGPFPEMPWSQPPTEERSWTLDVQSEEETEGEEEAEEPIREARAEPSSEIPF